MAGRLNETFGSELVASPEYVSKADLEAFGTTLVEQIVPRLKQSQKDVIKAKVSSEVGEKLSSFDEVVELLKPHLPKDRAGKSRVLFVPLEQYLV